MFYLYYINEFDSTYLNIPFGVATLNVNDSVSSYYKLNYDFRTPLLSENNVSHLDDDVNMQGRLHYNQSNYIFYKQPKNKLFISNLTNEPVLKNVNPNQDIGTNELNNRINFWTISLSDIISLFLGIVAFIAALPTIIGFFVSHFYKPNIEVFFPPKFHYEKDVRVKWDGLKNPNVRNNTSRIFQVELEIISLRPWQVDPKMQVRFPHAGLRKEIPGKGGFWRKTNSFELSSQMSFTFPLIPEQQDNNIRLIIHPRIKLAEFGFPSFYGEILLRSLEFTFMIEP
jgi:hypothetical protein